MSVKTPYSPTVSEMSPNRTTNESFGTSTQNKYLSIESMPNIHWMTSSNGEGLVLIIVSIFVGNLILDTRKIHAIWVIL